MMAPQAVVAVCFLVSLVRSQPVGVDFSNLPIDVSGGGAGGGKVDPIFLAMGGHVNKKDGSPGGVGEIKVDDALPQAFQRRNNEI